jgi:hypothetical protein
MEIILSFGEIMHSIRRGRYPTLGRYATMGTVRTDLDPIRSGFDLTRGVNVDDIAVLTDLNTRFIDAFRKGSWELLQPILSPDFRYLDGNTGERWEPDRYSSSLQANPVPDLGFDQVDIHIDGNVAVVSARTFVNPNPQRFSRYVDAYERRDGQWLCYHACVWRLQA